ncbi:hypothetical protein EV286_11177 [Rhizobium sp. BK251]|nr:hypothetical protein EV286_11177 [Rhizobium sp. BK251]
MILAEALRARFSQRVDIVRLEGSDNEVNLFPSEKLELRVFGEPSCGHTAWIPTDKFPTTASLSGADLLVIDLTEGASGDLPLLQNVPAVLPVFHGSPCMRGLLAPLLACQPPHLGIVAVTGGERRVLYGVELALPDPDVFLRVLATVLARTITLLCGAVDNLITGKKLPEPISSLSAELDRGVKRNPARDVVRRWLPKVTGRLVGSLARTEDWCIGYRKAMPASEPPALNLDRETFTVIEPYPDRFYADPILFEHSGKTSLFFEDYDYRTGIARISHVSIANDGQHDEPCEVLSRPYHLSYPFILSYRGSVFMLPETSNNRTIELYVAKNYPHDWRLASVLMSDIEASDATLYYDEGRRRWWMFASVTEFGSSSYDTLSIFYADNLEGPWHPHGMNPVKIDPLSSRPAGPLVLSGGRLFRPAQDCTRSYGSALVWCEITELTTDVFREAVIARKAPSRGYSGMHTYSRAGDFEVIDLKRFRWRRMRKAMPTGHGRLLSVPQRMVGRSGQL